VGYPIEKDPDRDYYIGTDAMQKRAALELKWPVKEGVVSQHSRARVEYENVH